MRIRYHNEMPEVIGRRAAVGYCWTAENGFVQDVDAGTAANLLTLPGQDFVVDAGEPLRQIGGLPGLEVELALAGIGSLAELAGLDRNEAGRLAQAMQVAPAVVRGWIGEARRLCDLAQNQAVSEPGQADPARTYTQEGV